MTGRRRRRGGGGEQGGGVRRGAKGREEGGGGLQNTIHFIAIYVSTTCIQLTPFYYSPKVLGSSEGAFLPSKILLMGPQNDFIIARVEGFGRFNI